EERRLPAKTVSRFCPSAATLASMLALAPLPTATIATTAATPMTMPSEVSEERSLFRRKARRAILPVCTGCRKTDWKMRRRPFTSEVEVDEDAKTIAAAGHRAADQTDRPWRYRWR